MNSNIKDTLINLANYISDNQNEQESYNDFILEGNSPLDHICWDAQKALFLAGEQIECEFIELLWLWKALGDVPIDDDETIDINFFVWAKGTSREDIWHWFEDQNEQFIVGEIMYKDTETLIAEELAELSNNN